MTNIFLKAI